MQLLRPLFFPLFFLPVLRLQPLLAQLTLILHFSSIYQHLPAHISQGTHITSLGQRFTELLPPCVHQPVITRKRVQIRRTALDLPAFLASQRSRFLPLLEDLVPSLGFIALCLASHRPTRLSRFLNQNLTWLMRPESADSRRLDVI